MKWQKARDGGLCRILELIALGSNNYSFRGINRKGEPFEATKSKGIVKTFKKKLLFDKHKEVLKLRKDVEPVEQTGIVCKQSKLYANTEMKLSLGYYDDKRYSSDGINCCPQGYHRPCRAR